MNFIVKAIKELYPNDQKKRVEMLEAARAGMLGKTVNLTDGMIISNATYIFQSSHCGKHIGWGIDRYKSVATCPVCGSEITATMHEGETFEISIRKEGDN